MIKSLEFFFKLQQPGFLWDFFFRFGQILFVRMFAVHHEKIFVPALFKVSIDHLFDILETVL